MLSEYKKFYESNFQSFSELKERYDIKPNFLTFSGVVSFIKPSKNTVKTPFPSKENHTNALLRSFSLLAKQTEWFIKNASAPDRLVLENLKTEWLDDC